MRGVFFLLLAAGPWACGGDGALPGRDAGGAPPDSGAEPDAALDSPGGEPDSSSLPPFPKTLAPASELGERAGRRIARAVIHFHTPISHDACDGDGWVDGVIDEECLADMRRGICETRQDIVFATDHDDFHAEVSFPDVFLMREGDEPVLDGLGRQIGSTIACPDGTRPLFLTGEENEIMPVVEREHPGVTGTQDLHDLMNASDLAAADAMRGTGALVLVPHAEHWTPERVVEIGATGIELYNFHANLDRDIREEYLGLPADDAIANVLIYALDQDHPEPDLAFTAFFAENGPDIDLFDTLLGRGVPITGLGGNDVHQNSAPGLLADGERGDSYRRLLRWLSNYLLVDELTADAALEAIAAARLYVAFDAFGTPAGFDFRAEDGCGDRTEMGGEVDLACEPALTLDVPSVHALDPSLPAPIVRASILRVGEGVREEVATAAGGQVVHVPAASGVYRAVVWITPEHYRPYFNGADAPYVREFPWVYSNAIRVR
ncbi:MAG: hypothetical protein HYY06_20525 [Deltaproteobacteria bacterium]|nr:hypothetical protein [Deltaproteobacteria bacterium]